MLFGISIAAQPSGRRGQHDLMRHLAPWSGSLEQSAASPATSGSVSATDPGLTHRSQLDTTARAHRRTLHGRVIADGFPRLNLSWYQEAEERTVRFDDSLQDSLLVRQFLGGIQLITDCFSLSQKRCNTTVISGGAFCHQQSLRELDREGHEPMDCRRGVFPQRRRTCMASLYEGVQLQWPNSLP